MPSSRFYASARDQLRAERAAARVGRLPSMSVTQRAEVFHALLPDVLRDILLSVGRKLRADRGTRGVVPVVLLEFESPEALSLAVDKLLLLRAFVSHLPVRATGQGLACFCEGRALGFPQYTEAERAVACGSHPAAVAVVVGDVNNVQVSAYRRCAGCGARKPKLKLCTDCWCAAYCDVECARADYQLHAPECAKHAALTETLGRRLCDEF